MTCPRCINTSCPSAVTEVSITENTIEMDLSTTVDEWLSSALSTFTLTYTPHTGFAPLVFVNGVLQEDTNDYTLVAKVLTFSPALTGTNDIKVVYVPASA